jgi:hypothetical protein
MRLTVEQRLRALERDNVVLHGTIKLLHKMLKDQEELIRDYIRLQMVGGNGNGNGKHKSGTIRPCDEVYTFVCRRRLDKTDRDVKKIHKSLESLRLRS